MTTKTKTLAIEAIKGWIIGLLISVFLFLTLTACTGDSMDDYNLIAPTDANCKVTEVDYKGEILPILTDMEAADKGITKYGLNLASGFKIQYEGGNFTPNKSDYTLLCN